MLTLRPATPDDLPWIEGLATEPDVAYVLARGTVERLRDAVDDLVVFLNGDGARVGAAQLVVRNQRSRIAEIRALMIDPAQRRRGLGLAAVHAAAAHAFGELGMYRLEAETYGFNEAARRTFRAAGFTEEGVRRRAYDRHGARQDGIHFGLLADE